MYITFKASMACSIPLSNAIFSHAASKPLTKSTLAGWSGAIEDAMPKGHGQRNLAGEDIGLEADDGSLLRGWNERGQREILVDWVRAEIFIAIKVLDLQHGDPRTRATRGGDVHSVLGLFGCTVENYISSEPR